MSGEEPTIVYVITDLKVGGVPLHLHRLAVAMRGRGYRPMVVSLAPPGPVAARLQGDGIAVESCHGCCGWDLRVIGKLARILNRHRPDIVHAMLFHANLAVRLAARRAGTPMDRVLCEIQTVEVERRWHLTVDRWTHRRCRLTIGNSPSVIEHLAVAGGIPRHKLLLVRGGIDPDRISTAQPVDRAALGVDEDTQIVFWSGRLDPVKGLDHLIGAMFLLPGDIPVQLLLAGDGNEWAALSALIDRLGLGGRVRLLGPRDDVPSILKAADVFAFPSRTEGLPNALLEAMAAGCPIVTTDVPGCRDLIRHEENGLVVNYGDAPALAEAIQRLLDERSIASTLGARAKSDVAANWHIDTTLDAYAAVYEDVRRPQSTYMRDGMA